MRRGLKLTVVVAVIAVVAAMGATTAVGQTTTTSGGSSSGSSSNYGPGTNGNAKAAKAVSKKKVVGPVGSGLTRGVTSSSIKVGCYLQTASFAGFQDGLKARFDRANKSKELPGGRQIDIVPCSDDGGNPQTNLQIVQKAVQQDAVFAVFGASATVLTPSTDFMNNNQVPYFGWGFLPGFCGTRWGFGFDGCLVTTTADNPLVYQANLALGPIEVAGIKNADAKFALQSQDNDSGHTGNTTISNLIKAVGAQVVYNQSNIPDPSSGVNFTPFVQAINAAKPNILLSLTNFQTIPGLTAAMTASGYTGLNINYVGYIPGLLSSSAQLAQALNGAVVSSQIVPQEAQTSYIKQFENDLVASGAPNGKFITNGAAIAYAEADIFVSQLKAVGKTLNTKTFDSKINGGTYTYKSDGGPGQMSFPAMHWISADCSAALKINGSAASYTQVVPFTCYDSVVKKNK
jgi:ABC-type branched-subunit amino acid transport system substrate-binding protein